MKIKTAIVLLCLFAISSNLFSSPSSFPDNNKGSIKAVLLDASTKAPIEYANVTLHNAKDSSFVNGTVSGNKGEFKFTNLSDGQYYVKISYIGYEKKTIPDITVAQGKNYVTLGTITLSSTDVQLSSVNVVGEKASEELHLDKKVINVSQNLSASGGTALDVLQNQPSIQVDQDGNVTLRGNSNFKVQINGRPSPIEGSDALRQIPANLVESIELITNPSAKYDAEGSAGIINVIMKKQIDNNMSGIVNMGAGSRTKYNGDFTINYKTPGYSLNGGLNYMRNTSFINQYFDRNIFSAYGASLLSTDLNGKIQRDNFNMKFGLDYNLSDKSVLSYSGSAGKFSMLRNFTFDFIDYGDGIPGNEKYTLSDDKNDYNVKYINTTVYYNQQFEPKVEELSLEATYTNVDQPSNQTTKDFTTDISFQNKSYNPPTTELINDTKRNDGRIKTNYFHTFGEKAKLEGGLQADLAYRNLDIISQDYDFVSGSWIVNPLATYKFDFRNNVYAAFMMYTNALLGFDYQLGLRAEETDRLLTQKTLGSEYKYDKLHFFPSVNVSTKISDEQQVQFSYSRRINRPNEFLLNPFPNISDVYVYSIGNPELLPQLTNSFELNYQRFSSGFFFSVQSYYRHSNNSFTQTQTIESDGRIKLTFDNIAKSDVYGAEISSSLTITQWLKVDPSVNLYNSSLSGLFQNEQRERNMFTWSSRLTTNLSFSPVTRFQVMLNYIGKQQSLQADVDPIVFLTFSLRHELFEKALSVSLVAQNLFNAGRFGLTTSGSNFDLIGKIRPEAPIFRLNLSFNFNNFKNTSKTNDRVDLNINEGL